MIVNVSYQARKKFKYNGKQYKPGDTWEPVGLKGDRQVKRSAYVIRHESVVNDSGKGKVRMGIDSVEADLPDDGLGKKVVPEKVAKPLGRKPRTEVKPKVSPKAPKKPATRRKKATSKTISVEKNSAVEGTPGDSK